MHQRAPVREDFLADGQEALVGGLARLRRDWNVERSFTRRNLLAQHNRSRVDCLGRLLKP